MVETGSEFPIGKVLMKPQAGSAIHGCSRKGDLVAFLDHPLPGDDGGSLRSWIRTETLRLWRRISNIQGLAWSADGREILVTPPTGSDSSAPSTGHSGRP